MILKDKSILIVSPEPWAHLFVSKHHYAVHLAQRGNKVFFPKSSRKRIVGKNDRIRKSSGIKLLSDL